MRLTTSLLLICSIVAFVGLALFFWTDANLTHMKCCSQEWVDNAPDPAARDARAEVRARSIVEVAKLKKRSQLYSLSCLAGATGLAIVFNSIRKKRGRTGPPFAVGPPLHLL